MDNFERLGLALAIGFLVGIERGWRTRDLADGSRTAGVRTYALAGILGGVAGLLSQALGGWAFAGLALPFAAGVILFKLQEQAASEDRSATEVVAALLVFGLGAYACVGDTRLAAAAGVVTAALLAFKSVLHAWLRNLTWAELRSALVLLAMTFVLLPVIPDRQYGPYGSLNPRELWAMTIGLAGVSFVGYAATRAFGPTRGALLGSAAGALISSTGVTLHLAREERRAPSPRAHAGMAMVAGAVMAFRIGAIALALSPSLARQIAAPVIAFALVSLALGLAASLRSRAGETAAATLKSPFDLASVVKFALVLGAVIAASKIVSGLYGPNGLLAVAALAGVADVDAVTLSATSLVADGADVRLVSHAVLLAAAVDSVSKSMIATIAGSWRFGSLLGAGTAAAIAAAAVASALIHP